MQRKATVIHHSHPAADEPLGIKKPAIIDLPPPFNHCRPLSPFLLLSPPCFLSPFAIFCEDDNIDHVYLRSCPPLSIAI